MNRTLHGRHNGASVPFRFTMLPRSFVSPLAGMTLFAGILRDEIPTEDERRGHVDKIQRELGYLERVVNDFLEYARRPKPELGDVEATELLAELVRTGLAKEGAPQELAETPA